MESLYFWIPMVLVLSGLGIAVYVWAINDGQYDDLDRPAQQMLMDDDDTMTPAEKKHDGS
jgi:cbb3-type cytochrome oxidase maturation protein